MKELNKNCVYSLEDLTSEELKELAKYMQINHGWKYQVPHTDLFWHDASGAWLYNKLEKVNDMVNAKELFYTLENVAIVANDLTKEQKKHLESVFVNYTYFRKPYTENKELISYNGNYKYEITYEKFMELFAETQQEVTEKPQHYSKGIDTFARMEANCTKEECLAFAKGNIDKYNFRTKGQDLEDYKKIISYANWAIKLLKDEK